MKCFPCEADGAIQRKIKFQSGATVTAYLCQDCADAEGSLDEVKDLISSPST